MSIDKKLICNGDTEKDRSFLLRSFVVENTGIEPVTSCMPCKRSPS